MKWKLASVISRADLKDVNSRSGVGGALSHCGVEAKRGCQLAGLVPVCVPARGTGGIIKRNIARAGNAAVELDFVTRAVDASKKCNDRGWVMRVRLYA